MKYYIKLTNNKIASIAIKKLYNEHVIAADYADFLTGKFYEVTKEQRDFQQENPDASFEEIIDMELKAATFTVPEPEPEKSLAEVIADKVAEIENYDSSRAVNNFIVNDEPCWLTPEERADYKNSLDAAKLLEVEIVEFWLRDMAYSISIEKAEIMLAQLQLYANKCFICTQKLIQEVRELTTKEEVEEFDYKSAYPQQLTFKI
jgi:hypothetical protein